MYHYAKQEVTCLNTFWTGDTNVMAVEHEKTFQRVKNTFPPLS